MITNYTTNDALRTVTRATWYANVYPTLRRIGIDRHDESRIGSRARLHAVLDRVESAGHVGVGITGTDCDGYSFHWAYVYPTTKTRFYFETMRADYYEHADGPMSVYFFRPSKCERCGTVSHDDDICDGICGDCHDALLDDDERV